MGGARGHDDRDGHEGAPLDTIARLDVHHERLEAGLDRAKLLLGEDAVGDRLLLTDEDGVLEGVSLEQLKQRARRPLRAERTGACEEPPVSRGAPQKNAVATPATGRRESSRRLW